MEKTSAAVVSQAFPHPQDPGGGGAGELGPSRKKLHPALVVGNDGGDPGLLAHEFGHGRAVRSGVGTPGERAVVPAVPGVQKGQGPPDFGFDGGAGGSSVGAHG